MDFEKEPCFKVLLAVSNKCNAVVRELREWVNLKFGYYVD